jgi:hypothetical protein
MLTMARLEFSQLAVQVVILPRGRSFSGDYADCSVRDHFNSGNVNTCGLRGLDGPRHVSLPERGRGAAPAIGNGTLQISLLI